MIYYDRGSFSDGVECSLLDSEIIAQILEFLRIKSLLKLKRLQRSTQIEYLKKIIYELLRTRNHLRVGHERKKHAVSVRQNFNLREAIGVKHLELRNLGTSKANNRLRKNK